MGIYDVGDLDNAQPIVAAKPGEYQLRIISAEGKDSSKGKPMISLRLEILTPESNGNPNGVLVDDLYHYLSIPDREADPKTFSKQQQAIKDFCQAFNINTKGGLNTDNMIGQTGWATLSNEEYEGRVSAKIKSVSRPRMATA